MSDTILPSTPESPGEMFVSPLGSASSKRVGGKASPRLSGISRLMKTPKHRQRQSVDLSGLKSLMKTPKTVESPALSGVKQLMNTPKTQQSPTSAGGKKLVGVSTTPELDGIRKLVKTPKPVKSPALEGVKQLMKTPKAQKSPALEGVKKLVTTPKDAATTPKLGGVRNLVKTPKIQKSPSLVGMKKLLKTPKPKKSPQLAGLKTLMRTPKQQQSPVLAGVRQLMKTPKSGAKSPDFVGVNEMLASLQTDVSVVVDSIHPKSVPKKNTGKKIISPVSQVLSPKARATRGSKAPQKTVEKQLEVEVESLSRRKRGAAKSKLADEVVVSKRPKLVKADTETETATSRVDVNIINSAPSPATRRGRTRNRRQAAEETDVLVSKTKKPKASSSTPVTKTGNKISQSDMSEVVVDARSSPKTSAKSTKTPKKVAGAKMPKKAPDATDVPYVASVDLPVRHKAVETSDIAAAKKRSRVAIITPVSTPTRRRGAGRVSKSKTDVAMELSPAADSSANVAGRKKRVVADNSVKEAVQVGGRKSRAARKQNDAVAAGHAESQEDTEVIITAWSTGSHGAKKAAAKTDVKAVKGTESHVDSDVEKPVAGKAGKPARSKKLEPKTSKKLLDGDGTVIAGKSPVSTRRGKSQVAFGKESLPAAENAEMLRKGQESPTVAGGHRGKLKSACEEPQKAVESTMVKMPSRGKKDQETAKEKESSADSAANQPVGRGKTTASKQVKSIPSISVSAKSPVTTRGGRRQVNVEETLPVAEDIKVQKKSQENPAVARLTAGRRGKNYEVQPIVETSSVKTPSRSRKRPQTSDEAVDAPVTKQQHQHAGESVVAEQPTEKAAKCGKPTLLAEPLIQPDKLRQNTGAKKTSQSAVKKSAGKKLGRKLEVVDSQSESKLYKKKNVKIVVEQESAALVSPPGTRSKRAKR